MKAFHHAPAVLAALLVTLPVAAPAASGGSAPATAKRPLHAVLPFIDDDLPRALAEAKQRDLPMFVESWAPW